MTTTGTVHYVTYAEVCARITMLAAYLVFTLDVFALAALLQEMGVTSQ